MNGIPTGLVDISQCLLVLKLALWQLLLVISSWPNSETVLATALLSCFRNEKQCQDWVSPQCEDNSCLKWTCSVPRDRLRWLLSNPLFPPWLPKCLSIGKGGCNLSVLRPLMYSIPDQRKSQNNYHVKMPIMLPSSGTLQVHVFNNCHCDFLLQS